MIYNQYPMVCKQQPDDIFKMSTTKIDIKFLHK